VTEIPLESVNSDGASTCCVLLAAGGEQPPERLLKLLDQPSTRTVTVAHPLLAAAELSSFEASLSLRRQQEPAEKLRTVLVVVNRESWRDLSPLFRTVRILMPAVAIWVCTERVAIEVYAGTDQDANHVQPPVESPTPRVEPEVSENPPTEPIDAAKVSEDELRFLLDLYDSEAEDDSESDEPDGHEPEELP